MHFCSIQALKGLDDAHPHWGGPSAFLSLWIQMPISLGHGLTDTPRNYVYSGHPLAQSIIFELFPSDFLNLEVFKLSFVSLLLENEIC